MIDFELKLPAKEKKGFTQKEFENWIAKRPSSKESNGAWKRFVDANNEAVRKDKLVAEARAVALRVTSTIAFAALDEDVT